MKKKTITCPLRGEPCHKENCEWYIVYEKDTGICAVHSISEGIWLSYKPEEDKEDIAEDDDEVEEVSSKDLHKKGSQNTRDISTYIR